jgi:hypothetical protein
MLLEETIFSYSTPYSGTYLGSRLLLDSSTWEEFPAVADDVGMAEDIGAAEEFGAGSSTLFAEVVSVSQLAQKKPVRASAILFQCL